MTTPSHTPGPWVVCSGMVETVPTDTPHHEHCGIPIAHMDRTPGNGTLPVERDANARLIAAAPDLLTALEEMVLSSPYHVYADRARHAIRKATGQEG